MSAADSATSPLESLSTTEPLNARGNAVRFETQCVVIPDPEYRSRLPRVVTKSYAVPLWKRRTSGPASPPASAPPEDVFCEENNQSQLVLRVPVPTFSLRPRLRARSVDEDPPPPCLVHRPQRSDSSPSSTRHARTPRKPSPSPTCSDTLTVPLRQCCAACQRATEAALAYGDAWQVHFSRAASKRRSSSADAGSRTITVAGSAASASYGNLGVSISVDEIDKRRRLSDTEPSVTNPETLSSDDAKANEVCRVPLVPRLAAVPNPSATDAHSPLSPSRISPAHLRIPEEEDDDNENDLFPLPSPKRTPTASPAPSPAGSLSSLAVAPTNQSPRTSPTASSCSGDFTNLHQSKRQFLAPPPCPSSSSLSLAKLSESTTDLTLSEDASHLPDPPRSWSPSPHTPFTSPTSTGALTSATDNAPPRTVGSPETMPRHTPTAMPFSTGPSYPYPSSHHSLTQTRLPWRSKRSASGELISPVPTLPTPSFSSPPTLSTSPNTKKSFSMSGPRQIIADVLRGVGTMGSSSLGPGF